MKFEFEILEEFSIASEVSDAKVTIKLRHQLNHNPTRYSPEPYCLDLTVGSIRRHHYGIDEQRAREAAARFLLEMGGGLYRFGYSIAELKCAKNLRKAAKMLSAQRISRPTRPIGGGMLAHCP